MTSEYVIDEIAKSLDLNPNRFELVAALLGCHILTVSDLSEFHQKLVPELKQVGGGEDGKDYKVGFDRVIRYFVFIYFLKISLEFFYENNYLYLFQGCGQLCSSLAQY